MTIVPTMRAGTLAIVLAAGALAGCSSPGGMMAATNRSMAPVATAGAAPYDGVDYVAALDSVMTTDSSGD